MDFIHPAIVESVFGVVGAHAAFPLVPGTVGAGLRRRSGSAELAEGEEAVGGAGRATAARVGKGLDQMNVLHAVCGACGGCGLPRQLSARSVSASAWESLALVERERGRLHWQDRRVSEDVEGALVYGRTSFGCCGAPLSESWCGLWAVTCVVPALVAAAASVYQGVWALPPSRNPHVMLQAFGSARNATFEGNFADSAGHEGGVAMFLAVNLLPLAVAPLHFWLAGGTYGAWVRQPLLAGLCLLSMFSVMCVVEIIPRSLGLYPLNGPVLPLANLASTALQGYCFGQMAQARFWRPRVRGQRAMFAAHDAALQSWAASEPGSESGGACRVVTMELQCVWAVCTCGGRGRRGGRSREAVSSVKGGTGAEAPGLPMSASPGAQAAAGRAGLGRRTSVDLWSMNGSVDVGATPSTRRASHASASSSASSTVPGSGLVPHWHRHMVRRRWWSLCHVVLGVSLAFLVALVYQVTFRGSTSGVMQVLLSMVVAGTLTALRYAMRVSFRWARTGTWQQCSCCRMLVPLTRDRCLQCLFELRVSLVGGDKYAYQSQAPSSHFIWGGRHIVEVPRGGHHGMGGLATPLGKVGQKVALKGDGGRLAVVDEAHAGVIDDSLPSNPEQSGASMGGGVGSAGGGAHLLSPVGQPSEVEGAGGWKDGAEEGGDSVPDPDCEDGGSSSLGDCRASLMPGLVVDTGTAGGAKVLASLADPSQDSGSTDGSEADAGESDQAVSYMWLNLFVNEGQERVVSMFLSLVLELFTVFALVDVVSLEVFCVLLAWNVGRLVVGHGARFLVSSAHEQWPLQKWARRVPGAAGSLRWLMQRIAVDRISSVDVRVAYYKALLLTHQLQPERRAALAAAMVAGGQGGGDVSLALSGAGEAEDDLTVDGEWSLGQRDHAVGEGGSESEGVVWDEECGASTASGGLAHQHPSSLRVPALSRETDGHIRQMLVLRAAQDSMLHMLAVVTAHLVFLVVMAVDVLPDWQHRFRVVSFAQDRQVRQGLVYVAVQFPVLCLACACVCWCMWAHRGIRAGLLWATTVTHVRTAGAALVFVWLICSYLNAFFYRDPLAEEV